MRHQSYLTPAIEAPPALRAAFLTKVAGWTVAGLAITAVFSVLSMLFVVPAVLGLGSLGILAVLYGTMFISQSVARNMVYGETKLPGFFLGTSVQGISFGFILAATLFGFGDIAEGAALVAECLLMVVLTSAGMFIYVSMARREFSLLGTGLHGYASSDFAMVDDPVGLEVVCFSADWIIHGLLRTYTSSISMIFFTHSRVVGNQCVIRSTTTSYLGL